MSAPQAPSAYYRIDPLKGDNWLQWKRRVLAVMRDRGLLSVMDGTEKCPVAADPDKPTANETSKIDDWKKKDGQAQTQIELSISDAEMVHILQAKTSTEMWKHLCAVKEPRGALGILGARRRFYRITMEEGGDMIAHIAELRQIQNDVATMGAEIGEDEFMAVMATSLPESWDAFTQAYFGASGGVSQSGHKNITSYELAAVLIDEDRRRHDRGGTDAALFTRHKWNPNANPRSPHTRSNQRNLAEVVCYRCNQKGHYARDCPEKAQIVSYTAAY